MANKRQRHSQRDPTKEARRALRSTNDMVVGAMTLSVGVGALGMMGGLMKK